MGGISKPAKDLIDHLYARGEQEKRRRWDSETMRVALKKEFLDRLSMVLCIHRVYDFKFLGIPNMRAEGGQLAHLRILLIEYFDTSRPVGNRLEVFL